MTPEKLQKLFDYIHLSYDDEWDPDDIERSQNGDIWFDSQRDAYQSGLHDGEKEFAEKLDSLATEAEEEVKVLLLKKYSIPDVIEILTNIIDDAHHKGIPFDDCIWSKVVELNKLYKENH